MSVNQQQHDVHQVTVNPFTATLPSSSFGKRPIKVPNLKTFFSSSSSLHELQIGLLSKCTVLKVDLLQDHQIYCLHACR